jgi:hypothetical protein
MNPEVLFTKEDQFGDITERALVVKCNDLLDNYGNSPELVAKLNEFGLTPDDLQTLVDGRFEDFKPPFCETLQFGEATEYVKVRKAQLYDHEIEVASVTRDDYAGTQPFFEFQLRHEDSRGKVLVSLFGEATLVIPKTVEPTGLVYSATKEVDKIPFIAGTVAVIQTPTAWAIESTRNFNYVYISLPKYNPLRDITAVNPAF